MTFNYRSAIGSHVGMVRSNNQDSGFAGARLFFVADGMGGHAGGDIASSLVTKFVAQKDSADFSEPLLAAENLAAELIAANAMLSETVAERPELAGMGTTFSGFFTIGNKLAVAHIGDSRIYRFRDGELTQITSDHTFVQRLVDSGQITEDEAKTHPRRSVLMRVLGDVASQPEIDTTVQATQPGDIWLICSDGLCGYVDERVIRNELRRGGELDQLVNNLIDRALENGAPDNVTVSLVAPEVKRVPEMVADPQKLQDTLALPIQRFVGAAGESSDSLQPNTARAKILGRRRRKAVPVPEAHFEPRVDEYLAELIAETKRLNWRRRATWAIAGGCGILALTIAAFFWLSLDTNPLFCGH